MHLLHSHETGNTLCSSYLFNVQNQLKEVAKYLLTDIVREIICQHRAENSQPSVSRLIANWRGVIVLTRICISPVNHF